ncbi:uncharacterized protein LOC134294490 [Anolis carolinensis]|uniref:uncharacterized protein LOC134294490 n=1 Tax=Anolis carolinensis TaxID=28377 RepID=UPI002F2B6242
MPTMDDLEESLRQLKVQVDSLASSLNQEHPFNLESVSDTSHFGSNWPVALTGSWEDSSIGETPKSSTETERFLKLKHLLRPSEMTNLGLPIVAMSPMKRVTGLLGNEFIHQNIWPSVDRAFPLKLGSPHVIGVKSLLPPEIPVKGSWPKRSSFSPPLSLDHSGSIRSRSFSPPAKRTRWVRSHSQSPRPVWKPTSAKANACAQPPPQLFKKGRLSKQPQVRMRSSWSPKARGTLNNGWSPYSFPSASICSPTAQELNERFLQTLAESAIGNSLIETSPYRQELARLRLERLGVEEAWLLELKRQQELERTRGPKPKWYEMRNSQFHYEARKNNELLRNSQEVPSVSKYRQDLVTASKEFLLHPISTYLDT